MDDGDHDDYRKAEAHFGVAARMFRWMFHALAAVGVLIVGAGLAAGWGWWTAPYGLLSLAWFMLARGVVVRVRFGSGVRWTSQDAAEVRRFRRQLDRE
jgi:hypothetical protein